MTLTNIKKWGQGKPSFLAMLCQQIACFADDFQEILTYAKKQEHIANLPEPEPKQWLRFYYNRRLAEKPFLEGIANSGELGEFLVGFLEMLRALRGQTITAADFAAVDQQELAGFAKEVAAATKEAYQQNLAEIENEFNNTPLDDETKSRIVEHFFNQEFLFLYKVTLPCWFLFGAPPGIMLHRARQGDLRALENLLRLDKHVMADPGIMRQVQRLLRRNKYKYETVVARAIKDAPKFVLSGQSVAATLAGLISVISETFGQRLAEPEIRALFDAVAHDRSKGATTINTNLPDSPEAFGKAIQRSRKTWQRIIFPDKTL